MEVIPSILSKRAARGEGWGGAIVDLGDRYSTKGDDRLAGSMVWLGRNFNAFDEDSATDSAFANSSAHISIWCVFRLYEYCS